MSELVIRIGEDEKVMIEETENGVKQVKFILMEDLTRCISQSVELKISSGLLPPCITDIVITSFSTEVIIYSCMEGVNVPSTISV